MQKESGTDESDGSISSTEHVTEQILSLKLKDGEICSCSGDLILSAHAGIMGYVIHQ
jgi:hypothetical protein